MSVKLVRELATKAKLYEVTLPADGSFTAAIDVFGFNHLVAMLFETVGEINAGIETSANGSRWGVYEDSTNSVTIYAVDSFHADKVFLEIPGYPLQAPYIRFVAQNVASRGKTFYLYCV